HARLGRRAGSRRDDHLPAACSFDELAGRHRVIAHDVQLRPELAEVLDEVVGEAVVVVDDEQAHPVFRVWGVGSGVWGARIEAPEVSLLWRPRSQTSLRIGGRWRSPMSCTTSSLTGPGSTSGRQASNCCEPRIPWGRTSRRPADAGTRLTADASCTSPAAL